MKVITKGNRPQVSFINKEVYNYQSFYDMWGLNNNNNKRTYGKAYTNKSTQNKNDTLCN